MSIPIVPERSWGPAHRVFFRFTFAYLVLYNLPFPLASVLGGWWNRIWNVVVPWVGRLVRIEVTVRPNGSGDTTYNYVQVFAFLVIAAAATLVWTLLARSSARYERLHAWLRVYVRFSLAMAMIVYGSLKVIKVQFPDPSLDRLVQPMGDASPMGLLWAFMGASESYNVFTGAGEMLGGLLLTARRTTLLGALVSIGVLSNVVALNFSYDVPVKLYSCHLLAMAVFLVAPDLGRLRDLFLLNRRVEPAELRPAISRPWLRRAMPMLRTAVVVVYTTTSLLGAQARRQAWGDLTLRPPLHGIWTVDEFEMDGTARPPLLTDRTRWRRVIFGYPGSMSLQLMGDSRRSYGLKLDEPAKTLSLTKWDDRAFKATLSYEEPAPGLLVLKGAVDGHEVRARLRRDDERAFLLSSRGFHWINEYPFNR